MKLRHQPKLEHDYHWEYIAPGRAKGIRIGQTDLTTNAIEVEQTHNGIHLRVIETGSEDRDTAADRVKLQRFQDIGSIVFYAHPNAHGMQWSVPDNIANKHVLVALKKQSFRRWKKAEAGLDGQLMRLQGLVQSSAWQAAALNQSPKKLWTHGRELTVYQVWVVYRVAVAQLNLYHSGRPDDNSCQKLQECRGQKETLEHIFWSCPCAQACWQQLLSQWTGEQWTGKDIERFIINCASRTAPALAKGMGDNITQDHPDDKPQYVAIGKRIWYILTSVCVTTLWIQRNRVVFQQEEVTVEGSVQEFWTTGMRQLTALTK
ncbi:hypothetical protein PR003_g12314 [Phytophthora rubi]|uniref:Reverse transcriptase zinc-binding domain-containing protein n=1 Tax=Phytophthora rubi TaxID=129364 RepID=A0A6A3IEX2_9STRA|nr:hypothetical protein PR001_g23955 [Phytophthora rubi]KAE9336829.1 hypothetical protein PR003_g12314 [Phytophthora rubi]